ncbi:UNC93-like protein MFSD11 [Centruroides vittatus]|uniref:UNC93-like protein MFSD11 n=1 Tax=Centruroides vittatus TaxID=120091 RepID=UPI00350F06B4
MGINRQFLNIIILGFAFMFVFTAFQTGSMIQKIVIKSIKHQNPSYHGEGYTSLAVIYAVLAVCNWLAPSAISFTGPKYAMIIGAVTYCVFIANFLYPMTWGLYFSSVLIGIGAALIWTGQGNFLTVNSDSETISRNSGIFWAMLQCSLLFGNLFVFFEFKGEEIIQIHTINIVFGGLLGVCCFGTILFFALRATTSTTVAITGDSSDNEGPIRAFVRAFRLFKTLDMILLSITFFYTGLELSFFSSVYGTCIGFTKHFDDAAKYVGISGILIGAGEITGGTVFGLFGKKTNKFGRDPVVLLGYVIHMITFFVIFLNLPPSSPMNFSTEPTYIKSNVYLALFCSFLLGFGDSCFNTQIYSILGFMYSNESTPAFALFKFVQSVAAAAAFFYSNKFSLPIQLLILVITGTFGCFSFFVVEWKLSGSSNQEVNTQKSINNEN